MQENKSTELAVSVEVIEKMTEIAVLEIDGIAGLTKRSIDIKGAVKSKKAFKSVKVESVNGAVEISAFICVKQGFNVKSVAQAIQENVKDKIQTMTGTAVTKVNVIVADIEMPEEDEQGKETK